MGEFEFSPRGSVTICGDTYQLDATDIDVVNGLMTDFPRIFAGYDRFKALQAALPKVADGEKAQEMVGQVRQEHEVLLENCKAFIRSCLGPEAYGRIFAGRRPNCADHIELCTWLYAQVVRQREGVIAKYLDPPDLEGAEHVENESPEQPDH